MLRKRYVKLCVAVTDHPEFVRLVYGDALKLPLYDNSIDVAAQNCLFNIFKEK